MSSKNFLKNRVRVYLVFFSPLGGEKTVMFTNDYLRLHTRYINILYQTVRIILLFIFNKFVSTINENVPKKHKHKHQNIGAKIKDSVV